MLVEELHGRVCNHIGRQQHFRNLSVLSLTLGFVMINWILKFLYQSKNVNINGHLLYTTYIFCLGAAKFYVLDGFYKWLWCSEPGIVVSFPCYTSPLTATHTLNHDPTCQ